MNSAEDCDTRESKVGEGGVWKVQGGSTVCTVFCSVIFGRVKMWVLQKRCWRCAHSITTISNWHQIAKRMTTCSASRCHSSAANIMQFTTFSTIWLIPTFCLQMLVS